MTSFLDLNEDQGQHVLQSELNGFGLRNEITIQQYYSANSVAQTKELQGNKEQNVNTFYTCLDNSVQSFLRHTQLMNKLAINHNHFRPAAVNTKIKLKIIISTVWVGIYMC